LSTKTKDERLNIGYITFSGDAAEFMGKSYSPVVAMLLNLSPHKRFTPGGMLLLGLLPPKSKKTSVPFLYQLILERLEKDGCFTGFEIYDAYLKQTRVYRLEIAIFLEDLKGLPYTLCCSTTGCINGVCPWCTVVGVSEMAGCCRYFTSVLLLPMDSPIRKMFAAEFSEKKGSYLYIYTYFVPTLYLHAASYLLRTYI
jgi:hypothetical protein